ncbi:YfiR/HmsC family protein [Thalassomonas sp. RHCl1]|uniref:YfiR/HmsC family protein n=1 Tax=Thalassomonas sp. RHCl1 TaxID=2995320 RepID=UPI00248CF2A1|nr:YfiR/HmsC family protein [Thalassomonas sp. RHCl1]
MVWRPLLRHITVLLLLYLLSCPGLPVRAQELDSDQVKAAYLFNFIKHITWPDENDKSGYIIAVYDDAKFYRILKTSLSQRKVKGKSISVIALEQPLRGTSQDLLYIPAHQNADVPRLTTLFRQTHTLVITDESQFKHDVMINLRSNAQTSAISFEVNKSNILYEGLSMSAELLLFGGTELDVATLYRETELAMQKTRQREISLNKKIMAQQQALAGSQKKLTELDLKLKQRTAKLDKQQQELAVLKRDIAEKLQGLKDKEQELTSIVELLDGAEKELLSQQESVVAQELANQKMAEKIEANRGILLEQQVHIDQQLAQLQQQKKELLNRNEIIDEQQTYLAITSVLVLVALSVSALVVLLFIKNKKTTATLSATLNNLKDTQEQLIQSEKLASLGTLTAGIAHEINTPLGIAVTSTSMGMESTQAIRQQYSAGKLTKAKMEKYFCSIEQSSKMNTQALERVIDLLNNFKQVAADQVVGEAREVNLHDYIEEVMSTLFAEMKKHQVQYHFSGDMDVTITTIPGAFAQVLTNLVTNSIKHGFEHKSAGAILIRLEKLAAGGVKLIYQDDGHGMSQEVQNNIYEPFFTTKRNMGGTGLGMNIVYNIISKNLAGEIAINSAPDQGVTFTIVLPQSVPEPA